MVLEFIIFLVETPIKELVAVDGAIFSHLCLWVDKPMMGFFRKTDLQKWVFLKSCGGTPCCLFLEINANNFHKISTTLKNNIQ